MTFAKRLFSKASGKTASIDKTSEIEKTDTHQVPVQQTVVDLKQSQVEMLQNINASFTKNITNTVDSCQKQNDKTPEDSVLRRHYLTQLAAERKSITHPYPTDSVLRRHYESTFVLANKPANVNKPKIESRLSPRPTDSTLKRHYDHLVRTSVAELLAR